MMNTGTKWALLCMYVSQGQATAAGNYITTTNDNVSNPLPYCFKIINTQENMKSYRKLT